MAKAVYTFISYPDDVDTKSIELALTGQGLQWLHSPDHNADVYKKDDKRGNKKGDVKKNHVHWFVGFAEKPMDPAFFMDRMKQISKAISIHEDELVVGDPLAAVEYCTHKNNPEKAQYNEEDIKRSDCWCLPSYVTKGQQADHERHKRRQQKKQQKQDDLCSIEDILQHIGPKAEQVQSFTGLVNWAMHNGALQTVLDKAYFFRTYIDSMNLDIRCTKKSEYVIDQLEQQTLALAKENDDLRERLGFAEQSASLYYNQLFGEDVPASYTWGGVE